MMVQGIGSTVVLRHLFLFFVLLLAGMAAQAQEVRLVGVMGTRALIAIDGGAPKPLRAGETVDGVKVLSVSAQGIRLEIAGQQQGLQVGQTFVADQALPPAPPENPPASAPDNLTDPQKMVLALVERNKRMREESKGGLPAGGCDDQLAQKMGADALVLHAAADRKFYVAGQINSQAVCFLVDSGLAAGISINQDTAQRLFPKYMLDKAGCFRPFDDPGRQEQGCAIQVGTVQIGSWSVHGVEGTVHQWRYRLASRNAVPYITLGALFLNEVFEISPKRWYEVKDTLTLTRKRQP